MSKMMTPLARMGAAVLMFGIAGCAVGDTRSRPEEQKPAEKPGEQLALTSLFETKFPADFTFATSHPVDIQPAGDPAVIADTVAEIRIPGGDIVHRGPLPAKLDLAIPTSATGLEVTLRSSRGENSVLVPIEGKVAVIPVE
jgi:hypothetical protein